MTARCSGRSGSALASARSSSWRAPARSPATRRASPKIPSMLGALAARARRRRSRERLPLEHLRADRPRTARCAGAASTPRTRGRARSAVAAATSASSSCLRAAAGSPVREAIAELSTSASVRSRGVRGSPSASDLGARVLVAPEHEGGPRPVERGIGRARRRRARPASRSPRGAAARRPRPAPQPRRSVELAKRGGQRGEPGERAIEAAHARVEQRVRRGSRAHLMEAVLPALRGGVERGDRRRAPARAREACAHGVARVGVPHGGAPARAIARIAVLAERERAGGHPDDERGGTDRDDHPALRPVERREQGVQRREPRRRVGAGRARDHLAEPARHRPRRDRRPHPVQRLVERDAEAVLIRARVGVALGGGVRRRSSIGSEVYDAHAVVADQDVVGLDVAVDEPGRVDGGDASRRLAHHAHDLAPRPGLADPRAQRLPARAPSR